jgi:glycosyltransferase involved in cell wall biosynthesis
MAEAMLLGKPVIATNYSGNTAFMDAENSLLVDYSMVEVAADGPIYKRGSRWAEASTQNAALCMRRLFEDRAEAAALGKRGQRSATETLALRTAGERMKARLAELWRERRG